MIFCVTLPPLPGLEASRPDGHKEDLSTARVSIICIRGECLREFRQALSATIKGESLEGSPRLRKPNGERRTPRITRKPRA